MAALIHEPSVWILNEPMLGLDPKGAYELKEMMRKHAARGNSVLFSTLIPESVSSSGARKPKGRVICWEMSRENGSSDSCKEDK